MEELSQEIWQTIRRNKWRSLMTAFGVFWGLLMLILLVGLGNGIFNGIVGDIKMIPSNSLILWGGSTSLPYKGFGIDRSITLENKDQDAISANFAKEVRFQIPLTEAGTKDCSFGEHTFSGQVIGSSHNYCHLMPSQILYGRFLNEIDIKEQRKVCVIGSRVYKNLFPQGGDPSGKTIKVGEIYFTVIGVTQKLSSMISFGYDPEETLVLPITTEQLAYNQVNKIELLIVTLHDKFKGEDYLEPVKSVLKEKHVVHPDDKTGIDGFSFAEQVAMFSRLFGGITILLWIVGCGSLLAGLIGISNIMLVTVKERTQEIGIRRALGAKPRTILTQILAESLVLTAAAGLAGLMLGVWILRIVGIFVDSIPKTEDSFPFQNPQIDFSVAMAATGVIILGGLLAGWMPAQRAMKIKAIEALREE